jgi:phosphatidylglycerophosphate synthase
MVRECFVLADAPGALVELCGISILDRLLRTLQRCGVSRATIFSATPDLIRQHLARPSWSRRGLQTIVHPRKEGPATAEEIAGLWPEGGNLLLWIRGDCVFADRILKALISRNSAGVLIDSASSVALRNCAAVLEREWIKRQEGSVENALPQLPPVDVAKIPLYSPALRRDLRPFWFYAPARSRRPHAEQILLDSVQKGTQDLPACAQAPVERFLLARLCKLPVRPNQLTMVWAICAVITTILFASGQLGIGILIALAVGIIDGLDGKLARLKVETSEGGKLEHRLDSFFDVAWPFALALHFFGTGELRSAFWYWLLLTIAQALDGMAKGAICRAAEKAMRPTNWLDQIVRLVGFRRNGFVWIMAIGILLDAPAIAFVAAVWLQIATTIVDLGQIAWQRAVTKTPNTTLPPPGKLRTLISKFDR